MNFWLILDKLSCYAPFVSTKQELQCWQCKVIYANEFILFCLNGQFQKNIHTPRRTAFWNSEGKGGSLNWNSEGMAEYLHLEF